MKNLSTMTWIKIGVILLAFGTFAWVIYVSTDTKLPPAPEFRLENGVLKRVK